MSNNRSRWMWPVFCAGLLAGNLISHLSPAPSASAAPSVQNQGLPALEAIVNELKARTASNELRIGNSESRITTIESGGTFVNPTFEGIATFQKNGRPTAIVNDVTYAGIIAILMPPPDPAPVSGIRVLGENGLTVINSDSLTIENSLQRSWMDTGSVGTAQRDSNSEQWTSHTEIHSANGLTVSNGVDLEAHVGVDFIELLVIRNQILRPAVQATSTGDIISTGKVSALEGIFQTVRGNLNPQDYPTDSIYIPPQP